MQVIRVCGMCVCVMRHLDVRTRDDAQSVRTNDIHLVGRTYPSLNKKTFQRFYILAFSEQNTVPEFYEHTI